MSRTEPFDQYPDEYEAWFEKHHWVYLSELEAVSHFIPKKGRGIEIGMGTGRFALPLGITTGVEPSAAMREIADRQGLMVYKGRAEYLPLADRSYDFALMVTTVCFLDNVIKSFRDINRILKPGGRFVVGLVDENSPLGVEYQKIKHSSKFYRIATFYSTEQIVAYLLETGFGDIEVVQTVFGELDLIQNVQTFRPGYGEGGFVAIKAVTRDRRNVIAVPHGEIY
jgi:SAM-dependent methyltransferase